MSGFAREFFAQTRQNFAVNTDATVAEGWIDLKVRNDTEEIYQISVTFDNENIIGTVFADKSPSMLYRIRNGELLYLRKNDEIYEYVRVEREGINSETGKTTDWELLYTNKCKIRYALPDNADVKEVVDSWE